MGTLEITWVEVAWVEVAWVEMELDKMTDTISTYTLQKSKRLICTMYMTTYGLKTLRFCVEAPQQPETFYDEFL